MSAKWIDPPELTVSPERPVEFPLRLRIPAWCRDASVSVGGGPPVSAEGGAYHLVQRTWRPGDVVRLELPMFPTVIASQRSGDPTKAICSSLIAQAFQRITSALFLTA